MATIGDEAGLDIGESRFFGTAGLVPARHDRLSCISAWGVKMQTRLNPRYAGLAAARLARGEQIDGVCTVKNAFESEAAMVEAFLGLLSNGTSPWGELETTTEWDYRTGITDVLARTVDGQLVAFEAKLTDWRRASHQAYRNTTYASRVYVVMPADAAARARAHEATFSKFGIGLCSLDASRIDVLIEAPGTEPLLRWLHKRAHSFFDEATRDPANGSQSSRARDLQ